MLEEKFIDIEKANKLMDKGETPLKKVEELKIK